MFQFKKISSNVTAYMQEVNFKKFVIFNLFCLHFCFVYQVCRGNSSFRICGVLTCHGSVRNIILLYTHVILVPHITKSFHTQNFGCVTVTKRDTPTFVECCSSQLTCVIVWQCHNSKIYSWPNHRISLGRRSNCPYTVCGHVLVFSLSVLILSHEFKSGFAQFLSLSK